MNWDIASRAFIAIVGLIGVIWQVRRTHGGTWKTIKDELEVYALLPDDSKAKKALLERAEAAIARQIAEEGELKREPVGIILATIFLLISAGMILTAFNSGGWWWISLLPASFFLLFGIAGLQQDAIPRKRDEKGRPIER
ncbi:hypothetical protein GCM10009678_73760 [Actinomadura kijaniata]|uniref:Uncharacterized protein n=1 Tax=Actinomadura namibiensis TaxID=182080 RepID=A0A7W3LPP2_ACTNM|nr:hypothetical protein [Actinomadura namibiensis]MBA8951900.1 hypothetical protein [Actinomadura namibiensis]